MDISLNNFIRFLFPTASSNCDEERCSISESAHINLGDPTPRIEVIVLSDDDSESEADGSTCERDILGEKEAHICSVTLQFNHFKNSSDFRKI